MLLRRLGWALLFDKTSAADAEVVARMQMAAAIGAGLWILHPLFVSTTLYVVQREAMLPATFTLLGLLLWLAGRERFRSDRPLSGLVLITAGLVGCTILATLSKANGALLPLLVLIIEACLLRRLAPLPAPRNYTRAMLLLAALPATAILFYLAYVGWTGLTQGISDIRPWSLGQRLLTEPRVLMEYLRQLWLPRPFSSGLFNDQVEASTSLLQPASTLLSICTVAGLFIGAWLARKRFPLTSTAILFFFAGHLLESSTIALELQFEHRNYLPSILLFWPFAAWLCGFRTPPSHFIPSSHLVLKGGLAIALLSGLALMTHARASLWGDPQSQALLWAEINPRSPRAQANAASTEVAAQRPDLAIDRLKSALVDSPNEIQLSLGLLTAQCATGQLDTETLDAAANALATTRNSGGLLSNWFVRAIESSSRPTCPQLSLKAIENLVLAAGSNPYLQNRPGSLQDLQHLHGRIELARDNAGTALSHFNDALHQQVRIGLALQQAALLGATGYPELGLDHLHHYESISEQEIIPELGMPRLHSKVMRKQGYWNRELETLRKTLLEDCITKERAKNGH